MSILICQESLKGAHPLLKFQKCKLPLSKSLKYSSRIETNLPL